MEHKAQLTDADGSYEIDVAARFTALGADFLVLIECKHHRHFIKREAVQALHSRIQSVFLAIKPSTMANPHPKRVRVCARDRNSVGRCFAPPPHKLISYHE